MNKIEDAKISVIVTCYNCAAYIGQALGSVLEQSLVPYEIIVVDDGSTDDSAGIMAGYAERYGSRLTLTRKENGGHSSAVNAGFAASTGDVVCFLDSDDLFYPNKIETLARAWHKHPRAQLIYHPLQTIDRKGHHQGRPWPKTVVQGHFGEKLYSTAGWWPRPTTSGLSFGRLYLERVLPMPEGKRIYPDTYLSAPAAFTGEVVGLPQCLGEYRVHGNNTMNLVFHETTKIDDARVSTAEQPNPQLIAENKLLHLQMEFDLLKACLEKLEVKTDELRWDRHPGVLAAKYGLGQASLGQLITTIMTSPVIPLREKPFILRQYLR